MKKNALVGMLCLSALMMAGTARADSANAAFTVSVTFTPKCEQTNVSTPVIDFGAYSAFAAAITNQALSAPITIQCSRGLSPTYAFDNSNAAEGLFDTGNVRYTLSSITPTVTQAGTAATASSNGTAQLISLSITGTLPQQAGNSTSGALTTTRNIVVTF